MPSLTLDSIASAITPVALTPLQATQALAALAQETRLAIFRLLVQTGPEGLSVGTIAEQLQLANATLSFHLKELAQAGLVTAKTRGRFIDYSANFDTMNALIAYLTEHCCRGQSCASTLALLPASPCC